MQYDMTRAWKDEEYREGLEEAIESPVAELSEPELEQITGTGAGGGIGYGGGVSQGYGFAGGIVGNSYYCGNFSIRPRTNLNLSSSSNEEEEEDSGTSGGGVPFEAPKPPPPPPPAVVSLMDSRRRDARTNRFDFACSISGGIGAGICIFGGN